MLQMCTILQEEGKITLKVIQRLSGPLSQFQQVRWLLLRILRVGPPIEPYPSRAVAMGSPQRAMRQGHSRAEEAGPPSKAVGVVLPFH